MKQYKITKLKVREDAANKKTNQDLIKINEYLVKNKNKLDWFQDEIYTIEEGYSIEGSFKNFPKVSESLVINNIHSWFQSSEIKEIKQVDGNSWLIKTLNSIYSLEEIG
jgi:hypothetical protein